MLSAALVLAVFLGLAGFTLDEYYRQTAFQSLERELQGHVYTLLSAAKENAEGLPVMDTLMPNPDMNIPGSGLYASMKINGSDSLWKSASLEVDNSQFLVEMDPGEKQVAEKDNLMILSYGVAWEDFSGKPVNYTFSVASELTGVHQDLRDFRYHLVTWFGG
ncbi:MAG: hypothetical protein P8Y20_07330, partial [Gammaproteobacteria bacterium]